MTRQHSDSQNGMNHLLVQAFELVLNGHANQTDRVGKPYIGHSLRVAARLQTDELRVIGLLHNVLEHTDVTQDYLRSHFPAQIVDVLLSLTRKDGENYEDYIQRIAKDPVATRVKLADFEDNLDPNRPRSDHRQTIAAACIKVVSTA